MSLRIEDSIFSSMRNPIPMRQRLVRKRLMKNMNLLRMDLRSLATRRLEIK